MFPRLHIIEVLPVRWMIALQMLLLASFLQAATPAGTVIRNQASATFVDSTGAVQTVTSNLVETTIEQVPGLQLNQDQQITANPDSTVRFVHRIVNTGNGDDRYTLNAVLSGGNLALGSINIFADSNADGIADSPTSITETPWLTPNEDFFIVVEAGVPASATSGQSRELIISATSAFDTSLSESNLDKVDVVDGGIIRVTKSISASSGLSPSGPYTVTLRYENIGNDTAKQIAIIDALPAGMSYVANSGVWPGFTGQLTDANSNDVHSASGVDMRYCAYDASCTNLPEAQNDSDSSSDNQVTVLLDGLLAGSTGQVRFNVTIDSGLAQGSLLNQGEYEYLSSIGQSNRFFSNSVSFLVLADAGVVANGSVATSINGMNEPVTTSSAPQGGVVLFENVIWNTGHSIDTFNIEVDMFNSTFPVGTAFSLVKADGATPLLDTNSDGLPDTGPVLPGTYSKVLLRLVLPSSESGNNGGNGFDLTKLARSGNDSSVFDVVTDHLDEIIANQVDVTNQAAAGDPGALGQGPGPESTPVSTVPLNAAGFATFDLYVRHQGLTTDSYRLLASTSATGNSLPAGWGVVFKDAASGVEISQTNSLSSGESQHVVVELQAPADINPGTYSFYFEAVSDLTGARDRKHDAVVMGVISSLSLVPSLVATVEPGGSVVYEHVLTNTGNATISDIQLSVTDAQPGWSSVLYEDTDLDGFLSPGDVQVAGAISLLSGESKDLFLKVFAPGTASILSNNQTTIIAGSVAANASAEVTDITTVNKTHVAIQKEQAVDAGCDGVPDSGSDFGFGEIEVAPGNNCVIYRLTATNTGAETSYNVTIHDYTPPYTVYYHSASCSRAPCWITEPAAEATGIVNAETDQLIPGDSFYLQFSVRVQ